MLPIFSQWKTKSSWRPLSHRSFNYKFWWRTSIKCFTAWFRFRIPTWIFKVWHSLKIVIESTTSRHDLHKQSPRVFFKKVFFKFLQNHSKTALPESIFHATLIKKRLWHRSFPVNFRNRFDIKIQKEHVCKCFLRKRILFWVYINQTCVTIEKKAYLL